MMLYHSRRGICTNQIAVAIPLRPAAKESLEWYRNRAASPGFGNPSSYANAQTSRGNTLEMRLGDVKLGKIK